MVNFTVTDMLVFIRVIWKEDAIEHRSFSGDIISGNAKRTEDFVGIVFPSIWQLSCRRRFSK